MEELKVTEEEQELIEELKDTEGFEDLCNLLYDKELLYSGFLENDGVDNKVEIVFSYPDECNAEKYKGFVLIMAYLKEESLSMIDNYEYDEDGDVKYEETYEYLEELADYGNWGTLSDYFPNTAVLVFNSDDEIIYESHTQKEREEFSIKIG